MKKRKLAIILLSLLMALPMMLPMPSPLEADNWADKISKHTLTNGIRVFIYERPTSPTVSLYIGIRVGAVDDEEGRTGAAHFLEHLLFKGTANIGSWDFAKEQELLAQIIAVGEEIDSQRAKGAKADKGLIATASEELNRLIREHSRYYRSGELARIYAENGAQDLNAYTSKDITVYLVSLPKDKIDLWARLEAERMSAPIFREFYAERDVVAQERLQRTEGLPEGRLNELLGAIAFLSHPYRRPTIGWKDDIEALNHVYMQRHFRNFYTPENTFITVVGDVQGDEVMALLEEHFGKIPPRETSRRRIVEEPPPAGERRAELLLDANEQIIIGFPKPTLPHRDNIVFEAIEAILAEGRSSRLHRRLVESENPLAQGVSATNGYPGIRYDNLFCIHATPLQGCSLAEVEKAIYAELARLQDEDIAEMELRKIKNQKRFSLLNRLASNEGLASLISFYATATGDTAYLATYLQELEKVTAADIKRVARSYFRESNRIVATIRKR